MGNNNASNVTVGKPKTGGAVFRAPAGTQLPTTADAVLGAAFVNMGFISEDGVKNQTERESENLKAWGGDVVGSPQTSFSDKFTMAFLEAKNPDTLKAVFGDNNVSGSLAAGIAVNVNSEESPTVCWVIDTVLTDGVIERMVIPKGKISEVGEVEYVDGAPVKYEVTISAFPDATGNTHYMYLKEPASPTPAGGGSGSTS